MTSGDLSSWLEPKLDGVAQALADEIRALAVREAGETDGGDVAGALAEAALRGLDEVVARKGDRGTALRLLAADAALTLAFEAAAELGGDVSTLARRLGPGGELGRRIGLVASGIAGEKEPG